MIFLGFSTVCVKSALDGVTGVDGSSIGGTMVKVLNQGASECGWSNKHGQDQENVRYKRSISFGFSFLLAPLPLSLT